MTLFQPWAGTEEESCMADFFKVFKQRIQDAVFLWILISGAPSLFFLASVKEAVGEEKGIWL